MTKITLVTATIFNAEGGSDCGCTWQAPGQTLNEAKAEAREIAEELFNDNFNDAAGVIFNVNHIEVPELPTATVESEPQIEPVTLKIS